MISIRDLREGSRRQTVRAIRAERKLSLYPSHPPSLFTLLPQAASSRPLPCLHLFPRCSVPFQKLSKNIRQLSVPLSEAHVHICKTSRAQSPVRLSQSLMYFGFALCEGSCIETRTNTHSHTTERAVLVLTVYSDVTASITNSH